VKATFTSRAGTETSAALMVMIPAWEPAARPEFAVCTQIVCIPVPEREFCPAPVAVVESIIQGVLGLTVAVQLSVPPPTLKILKD
jgi:hypothetical protein